MPEPHWHAFHYAGRAFTDGQVRRGDAPGNYPPVEIKNWLAPGRAKYIDQTFHDVEASVDWLKGHLTFAPPLNHTSFPIDEQLDRSRRRMGESVGRDVVYGYYSTGKQYVSLALIECPRDALTASQGAQHPCPLRGTRTAKADGVPTQGQL